MKLNNLSIFTLVNSIGNFAWGLIGPFYVVYAQQVGGTIENLGIAFGLLILVESFVSYFAGKYSDKIGKKPFLIFIGFSNAITLFLYTLITTVTQLYVIQIFLGAVDGMQKTVSTAFLGDTTKRSKRGLQIGKYNMVINIFSGFSIMVGGLLIGRYGFQIIFYIGSFLMFIATSLLFFIKEYKK
jgi:MFS family permease